jgi:hypothetical protein
MHATRVDGIRIVDVRKRGDSFERTMTEALRLVREHDPRRYQRITRHIDWIVNEFAFSGALEYETGTRVCSVEFYEPESVDHELLAALYACGLVHEATHGAISSHGIPYDTEKRSRIERLCVKEQNRFVTRLAQAEPERYPLELLHMDFDEGAWKPAWTLSRWEKVLRTLPRIWKESPPKPCAAADGGATKPVDSSNVTEGPPSGS